MSAIESNKPHTHKELKNVHVSLTDELDLSLVVATDDRVSTGRLTPVQPSVLWLHLSNLQLNFIVFKPHHWDVARCNTLAKWRMGVAGIKGGYDLDPHPTGVPGHHPLKVLQVGITWWECHFTTGKHYDWNDVVINNNYLLTWSWILVDFTSDGDWLVFHPD